MQTPRMLNFKAIKHTTGGEGQKHSEGRDYLDLFAQPPHSVLIQSNKRFSVPDVFEKDILYPSELWIELLLYQC